MRFPIHVLRNRTKTLSPHAAYELWAPTYGRRENNALLHAEEQALLPILTSLDLAGKTVADIGCGTGRYLLHCRAGGASRMVGVDFSRQMLLQAKTQSDCLLCESSVETLPLQSGIFDVVLSTLVLAHIRAFRQAIREMARILKPQGALLVSDFHPDNFERHWKRTFVIEGENHTKKRFAAKSYRHPLLEYQDEFRTNNLLVEKFTQPAIDASLEPLFRRANTLHVYREFYGSRILIIFLLRKLETARADTQ